MPMPEPGTKEFEDMIAFMRDDLDNNMAYSRLIEVARRNIESQGKNFDEEFNKWKRENVMLFNIHDYRRVDCKQLTDMAILYTLIKELNYKMVCTTGCAWYNNGKCPGYKKIMESLNRYTSKDNDTSWHGGRNVLTNSQIADKIGISKRQVAKLRKTGELDALLTKHGL